MEFAIWNCDVAADTVPSNDSSPTISPQDDSTEHPLDGFVAADKQHPLVLRLYAFNAIDIEAALADINNVNQEFVIGGSSTANIDGLDYVQVALTQTLQLATLKRKRAFLLLDFWIDFLIIIGRI